MITPSRSRGKMMKSFADWTQEIAENNNHEPEPEADTSDPSDLVGLPCHGCGALGSPNYYTVATGYRYYCGGAPRCMP